MGLEIGNFTTAVEFHGSVDKSTTGLLVLLTSTYLISTLLLSFFSIVLWLFVLFTPRVPSRIDYSMYVLAYQA